MDNTDWTQQARAKLEKYTDDQLRETLELTLDRRVDMIDVILEHSNQHHLREIAEGE